MKEERQLLNVYKGILDIFHALKKAKSKDEVVELYVEYLKLQVQLSTNYPKFEVKPKGFRYGNCYTYALDLKCPDIFWNKYKLLYEIGMDFDVGLVSKRKLYVENSNERMLLDSFYKDCEALKIKVFNSSFDDNLKNNGYKVLMFKSMNIGYTYDYHFVRVNKDGVLSHMNGHNGNVEILQSLGHVSSCYEFVKSFEIVKPVIREKRIFTKGDFS